MNAYPDEYIVRSLPLVILTGLEPHSTPETPFGEKSFQFLGDGGFRIRAELPPLHHPLTAELRRALFAHDQSKKPWQSAPNGKTEQQAAFKIRSVGRSYTFPPRKAPPPPHSPRLRPSNDNGISPPPLILHSTLSPLSPSSPLYPDGIITPVWITKHQSRLPSVLVAFYNLVAESNVSSLEDNKIKSEVNSIRSLISSTNYKTKFVIVLVADGIINSSELEERLVNIRRGTNFDSKALYFLPSTASTVEISDFAKVLLTTLHPIAIEYYRDLSKHARRKRSRNTVPQPTVPPKNGTSSVLSLQGWNVRYEFKLGVFAETRQEFEAASRNFEQAYEGLFHAELFESIPFRSPRFNEARMLADIIVIRIIRCAFLSGRTTDAVKWWLKHKLQIQDLLDRRGRGTENYAWEAWQTIWSKAMVELIHRTDIFSTAQSNSSPDHMPSIQLISSSAVTKLERQIPWENLHHEGYWLSILYKQIEARRKFALGIDTTDTTQIMGSDTYLAPDATIEITLLGKEGDTYTRRIVEAIDESINVFQTRNQKRMITVLRSKRAKELCEAENWVQVVAGLRTLWLESTWRLQGWEKLLIHIGNLLLRSTEHAQNPELQLLLHWEIPRWTHSNESYTQPTIDSPVSTVADESSMLSQITSNVAFASDSGHVGEPLILQLSLRRHTIGKQDSLEIEELKLSFDGGIAPVLLKHSPTTNEAQQTTGPQLRQLKLSEITPEDDVKLKRLSMSGAPYWEGITDLSFSNGPDSIFEFEVIPREPGTTSAVSLTMLLRNEMQELTLNSTDLTNAESHWWEVRDGSAVRRRFGMHRDVTTTSIMPKPPKADIKLPGLAKTYYTNESLTLRIEVVNDEDEAVDGELMVRLISPSQLPVRLQWQDLDDLAPDANARADAILPSRKTDDLAAGSARTHTLNITGLNDSVDYELELKFSYVLKQNPSNTHVKQTMVDLPVVRPFEANALFKPRLHEEQWPDFFAAPDPSGNQPQGLKQKYMVRTDIGCFAPEPLVIHSLELMVSRIVGGATWKAGSGVPDELQNEGDGTQILPEQTRQFNFDLEMQKLVLGERSPVAADFGIVINWSRVGSKDINKSTLMLPRFLAPMAEPRVLLQASKVESLEDMYLLEYTIENPSMHFLTFNVSMESGDGFAFSGPKLKTVSLVPMSRYDIQYQLFMQKSKDWVPVQLNVLDAFFGQTLRIQPASEGVRVDKQGNIQVWSEGTNQKTLAGFDFGT